MPEEMAKYKGKYDAGYEPIRAARFEKMKQLGLLDSKAELSPMPEAWSDVEKKEFEARCMEVYAAQIDRMDQGIGKVIQAVEAAGQLDNTLIVLVSDNGASGEGGPNGSVNENKFFNGLPDTIEQNLKQLDELGRQRNPHLLDYKLVTASDAPVIEIDWIETDTPNAGPKGSKGVGEPPCVPTAGAIANAISKVIGARVRQLPMTPERVWEAGA